MRGSPSPSHLPSFSLSSSGRLDSSIINSSTTTRLGQGSKPSTATATTASGLPRFMQPTTCSKQNAAAASPQSIPQQSGNLACTPVLNISAKPSPSSAEPSTSSSKWKSSAAGSRPVFSVITRDSRQPAKQPLQPTKPQPTASRISRPPSSSASSTPQHSTTSKSLSLRGSTSTSTSTSSSITSTRTPSTLGTTSSSGASTPALASKLGASSAHARRDSISSCSSTASTVAAASTPPRSRDCRSLVHVLTFEDASDASTSSVRDQASTAVAPAPTPVQHSLKPQAGSARMQSRIPSAPGTAPAPVACCRAAGKATGVSIGGAGGACTDAGSTGARLAALSDIAPGLLSQRDDAASDQDSSSWLSDGCSEEGLQELAGGAGLPAHDELGGGLVSAGSSAVCGSSTGPVEPAAATRNVGAGGRKEASVLQAEQPVENTKTSGAEGGRGLGRGLWRCMLVAWSLVLVGVGLLAAAAAAAELLPLQEPRPLAAAGGVFFAFDDSDIGVLASTAAGRFMV